MVGIVGYGIYIPSYRIRIEEIAMEWGEDPERIKNELGVVEKSVPAIDEDSATFAVEAGRSALKHAGIDPYHIGAVFVGSESHPYAVKPTATIVAEAINATPNLTAVDMEFACKAGTTAIQCCMGMVSSGMIKYGVGIGTDVSQGKPGDALEYSTGAGAAAYIIGNRTKGETIAEIEATYSYTTDTPDFWRRPGAEFPSHGGRFTGIPAYFKHIINGTQGLFEKTGTRAGDYNYVVFHQPNGKFPIQAAKKMDIDVNKLKEGLVTPLIGNTYSAAALIGLAKVLDVAKGGEYILLTSFGSGAGSDSFCIRVTDAIESKRGRTKKVIDYINEREYLNYGLYVKHMRKLKGL
jgi:hydroxymethylglutaryl-CoA synthase